VAAAAVVVVDVLDVVVAALVVVENSKELPENSFKWCLEHSHYLIYNACAFFFA
jgi:hypothetical protein